SPEEEATTVELTSPAAGVRPMPERAPPAETVETPESEAPVEGEKTTETASPEEEATTAELTSPAAGVRPMPEQAVPAETVETPESQTSVSDAKSPETVPPAEHEETPGLRPAAEADLDPEAAPSTGTQSAPEVGQHGSIVLDEEALKANESSGASLDNISGTLPSTAHLEDVPVDESAPALPKTSADQEADEVPIQEASKCRVDASACNGDDNALNNMNEYLSTFGSLNCPCRQMLATLVCNLIVNQSKLTSSGAAQLDTPEEGTATLTLTGATCTALKQSCPQLAASQMETLPSFAEIQAAVTGDLKLHARSRAAQKVGTKVSESILRKVRLQRQIQAEAVSGFADLVQSYSPFAASAASFLGDSDQQTVWAFASNPVVGQLTARRQNRY
ncbi:IgA-specific serine endopeptidase, partial [Toxoplasma gondii TgCatPRC2]